VTNKSKEVRLFDPPIKQFISLDCETTGLDPKTAEIIEIAIFKYYNGRVAEKVNYFVDPGGPIPLRNQRLTGINDEMVAGAPKFAELAPGILDFIGDWPLVGHNITFDIKFLNFKLRQLGLGPLESPVYDTLRLAALLFPEEPSLKLNVLAKKSGVDVAESHRAEADAALSGNLFLKFQEYILDLPVTLLALLASLGSPDDGAIFSFLDKMVQMSGSAVAKPDSDIIPGELKIATKPVAYPPGNGFTGVDIPEFVKAAFEEGGFLKGLVENFAYRPGQPQMAVSFAKRLLLGGVNMIEAGCGMGKSMAYLVPAVIAAGEGLRPIVISTYTKNLQDQLAVKDLPALAALHPEGLKYTTLKGRANYICLSRVLDPSGRLYGADRLSPFERAILLSWIHSTSDGDIDRLNYFILNNFNNLKSHLNFLRAEGEFCLLDECTWRDECFVRASRKRAAASDIIITNHSLFFTGFEPDAEGARIFPEFRHVIFDEAHHLEDVISQSISLTLDTYIFGRLLKRFESFLAAPDFGTLDAETLRGIVSSVKYLARKVDDIAQSGEVAVRKLEMRGGESYTPRLILTPEILVKTEWINFTSRTVSFLEPLTECRLALDKAAAEMKPGRGQLRLRGFSCLFSRVEETLCQTTEPDLSSNAVWLDITPAGKGIRLRVNIWPLSVAEYFRGVVEKFDSCQFTSGTLSALGDINFMKYRLGLDGQKVDFTHYDAPFEMPEQARMFIPSDFEPPAAPDNRIWDGMRANYVGRIADALRKIILRCGGYTMCLFTSIQDLDDVGESIRADLEKAGITCLLQFRDGGKNALIDEFSRDPRTALLGTRSFFEGVDIPNHALKCLVIARLPFPHPDEPLHFGRLRQMAEEGIDGFANLSLPLANLSLRQAIGRLIRTPNDKGSVIFLDNRIITKSYGEALLNGLEMIPLEIGPFDEIVEKAAEFVGL